MLVPDLNPDLQYGFRLAGPNEAHMGQRFKADKVVIDPYAKASAHSRARANSHTPSANPSIFAVVT